MVPALNFDHDLREIIRKVFYVDVPLQISWITGLGFREVDESSLEIEDVGRNVSLMLVFMKEKIINTIQRLQQYLKTKKITVRLHSRNLIIDDLKDIIFISSLRLFLIIYKYLPSPFLCLT